MDMALLLVPATIPSLKPRRCVCAALSSVDSTDSRQAAVYIHLGILQICIGAVIGFTGRIGHRLELARTPDKVIGVPFVAVINVDIFSTFPSRLPDDFPPFEAAFAGFWSASLFALRVNHSRYCV